MPLLGPVGRPVIALRQNPVANDIQKAGFCLALLQLVRFGAVAAPMRELQIVDIAGVSAFGYRNDMVNAGRQRVRVLE